MTVRIIPGDCRSVLATLPAESVQCVVTSPPYFGLRAYLPDGHPDKEYEIGREPTLAGYIAEMVAVFAELRRVLRSDGVAWLNLGDSFNGGGLGGGPSKGDALAGSSNRERQGMERATLRVGALKSKDLLMVPHRVAIALQEAGWWVRQDIVWHKPNPMPESVEDRCTKAHEYVFLLAKSERYFFDAEAIKEPSVTCDPRRPYGSSGAWELDGRAPETRPNGKPRAAGNKSHKYVTAYEQSDTEEHRTKAGLLAVADVPWAKANRRSVWSITTRPFSGAHFATMPPDLAEVCIKAGSSERGCCPACGAPWARVVERELAQVKAPASAYGDGAGRNDGGRSMLVGAGTTTSGWRPTCDCPEAPPVPCTVLDPFGGAGTTGLVADRLGRDAVLIELNPEYAGMAAERLRGDAGLFAEVSDA
jgi:DNA modification methylase